MPFASVSNMCKKVQGQNHFAGWNRMFWLFFIQNLLYNEPVELHGYI